MRARFSIPALAVVCLLASIPPPHVCAAGVVINEFLAVNAGSYTNTQGQAPDWIELYNSSTGTVNLTGWYLTDDATDLRKWQFPPWAIPSSSYLLLYADNSDVAMTNGQLHVNFKLDGAGEYLALVKPDGTSIVARYSPAYPDQSDDVSFGLRPDTSNTLLVSTSQVCRYFVPPDGSLGTNWIARTGFDDSSWSAGQQGIGYELTPGPFAGLIRTAVPDGTSNVYMRISFSVANPSLVEALTLRAAYDDGFVCYLNGAPVTLVNAPASPGWASVATQDNPEDSAVEMEEFDVGAYMNQLVVGTNVLALHVMNAGLTGSVSNLLMSAELVASSFLPSPGGEQRYFHVPTPGARNVLGYDDYLAPVAFSAERGFYWQAFQLTLTSAAANAAIVYTLNGREPVESNWISYTGPLSITTTVVVRARTHLDNHEPSRVVTHTYIFPESVRQADNMRVEITEHAYYGPRITNSLMDVPTISIATERDGTNIDWSPELPASAELIYADGRKGFQINCGTARFGNRWTNFAKREFRLFFRSRYGEGKLRYPLFDGFDRGIDPVEEFDQLDLRSGSQDMAERGYYMAEAFCDDAMLEAGHLNPHGRFAQVYVNGRYWGLYHLHERWKANTFASYFGGQPEDYEAVDNEGSWENWEYTPVHPVDGDGSVWMAIQSLSNNYESVRAWMDVPQYIDWMLMWYMGNSEAEFRGAGPVTAWKGGYKFWLKDADGWLGAIGHPISNPGPGDVMGGLRLEADPDLVVLERDRIYRTFFNDGALTPERNRARLIRRCDEFEVAFYAESARWYYRAPESWAALKTNSLNGFATRTATMMDRLRAAGRYPIEAPEFNRHAGTITNTFNLTMVGSNAVYYTTDGTDPRQDQTGAIAGTLYTGPVTLARSTIVKARNMSGTNAWSGLHESVFVMSDPSPLRITEIMYNPRKPAGWESNVWVRGDYEFIELRNTGSETIGLAGLKFRYGIDFNFSYGAVQALAPGEYALVVNDYDAFTNRYGGAAGMNIAGEFGGNLDDAGERIALVDIMGRTNALFSYGDGRGWPFECDGAGHSLIPLAVSDQTNGLLYYGGNWRASARIDGSPGSADPEPVRDVVLNEIVAHTDVTNVPGYDSNDWIEMFNTSNAPVTLDNWYLSDDPDKLKKWRIPPGNSIAAYGWLTFDEIGGFHNPITSGFGLNKGGEQVLLSYLPGDARDRVADAVKFKGQENGSSLGRFRDGDVYWYALAPTANAANALPAERVTIGEIMYHPAPTAEHPEDNDFDEYVEIANPTALPVELWTDAGTWRLDGAVEFRFPTNTVLPSGRCLLVVGFDPADGTNLNSFLQTYGLTNGQAIICGPWKGRLSNRGERVALERPQAPDVEGETVSWVIVDEVIYFSGNPWPSGADATGHSIRRTPVAGSGNDPAQWAARAPTPGAMDEKAFITGPQDGAVFFLPFSTMITLAVDSYYVSGTVERVEFLADGGLLGADTNAPYEWTLDTIGSTGLHALAAEVFDGGGVYTSRAVAITVYGPPAVNNGAGASGMTDFSADIAGNVTAGGLVDALVYWGQSDGGTNAAAWDGADLVGRRGEGPFVFRADRLQANRTYWYRCCATNPSGQAWSQSASSFQTLSYDAWAHRMKISFSGYNRTERLTNFPALVVLGTNIPGFSFGDFGSASGNDLRFLNSMVTTALNYEVETWNSNGAAHVWVQVPVLAGTGDCIYAYWGNPSAVPPSCRVNGSVWSEGYKAVWHFDNDMGDSTTGGVTAAGVGTQPGTGLIGPCRSFNGAGDYVDPLIEPQWYSNNMNSLTINLFVRPAPGPALATAFGSLTNNIGRNARRFHIMQYGTNWEFGVKEAARRDHLLTSNEWQMLTLVVRNGQASAYRNSKPPPATMTCPQFPPDYRPHIGNMAGTDGSYYFSGLIDEVQISRVARSSNWVWACWMNAASNGSFLAFEMLSSEQYADDDADGMGDQWEIFYFGGTNEPAGEAGYDGDNDRLVNRDEFIAGTDPTGSVSRLELRIGALGGRFGVRYDTISATGAMYTGRQRYYDLEDAVNLPSGPWFDVPGQTGMRGDGNQVEYTNLPSAGPARFYRLKTRLAP